MKTAYLTLIAATLAASQAGAFEIIRWDWNDGTVQGWSGTNGNQANVGNQFQSINNGNGTLQMFSPDVDAVDLTQLTSISFDLTIDTFSIVSAPSEIDTAQLDLNDSTQKGVLLQWDLDLAGLAFGQTRSFNLLIGDAQGSLSLADVEFIGLSFAESTLTAHNSTARLDNFVLTGVPEPTSLALLSLGGLLVARRRRYI